MSVYVIVAVVSYLLGSIPFGYILVRVFLKTDIRQTGSGNIGATNVGRTGHKGLAIATLLLDAGKGALAVLLVFASFVYALMHAPAWTYSLASLAALCAIIGHMFPVWLGFRGGKGVATAVGAFAVLAPRAVLVSLALFLVTLAISRYVSLGSIIGAAAYPVAVYFLHPKFKAEDGNSSAFLVYMCAASVLVILKHHANIRRLISGTENKFGAKSAPSNSLPAEKRA